MVTTHSILLEGRVYFCSKKRCLSYNDKTLSISENESRLLLLLSDGELHNKNEIINKVWFERGIVVTDSSYYKLIRQLRNSLANFDIPMSTIKTLTRTGICYVGSISANVDSKEDNTENNTNLISIKPLVIEKPQKIFFNNSPTENFFLFLLISLFVVALTGCAKTTSLATASISTPNTNYKLILVADNRKIPTGSFITVTISKNKTEGDSFDQIILTEFSLKTSKNHATYYLSLPLGEKFVVLGKVNVSVRIEDNGIPIMTSVVKEIDLIKSKEFSLRLIST